MKGTEELESVPSARKTNRKECEGLEAQELGKTKGEITDRGRGQGWKEKEWYLEEEAVILDWLRRKGISNREEKSGEGEKIRGKSE